MSNSSHRGSWLLFVLLVAASLPALFRTPYNASNLAIVPDSVEYAVAARRLAVSGTYDITIDGRSIPPRYPPSFSTLFLAPAYKVLGNELGNAIFPVTLMGVFGVLLAFLIGKRSSGHWGGTLAALSLLALPPYRLYGREVMTDVPCTVLVLACFLLYLMVYAGSNRPAFLFGMAGVAGALAVSLRPVCAAVVFPFLIAIPFLNVKRVAKLTSAVLLCAPFAIVGAANAAFNQVVFGPPLRNGYQFWCAVPLDYPAMTFSLSYLRLNLGSLWRSGFPLLLVGGIALTVLARTRQRRGASGSCDTRAAWLFILLFAGPSVLFHLVYFFGDARFFLPSAALLAVLCAGLAGLWAATLRPALPRVLLTITLAGLVLLRLLLPDPAPNRRIAADAMIEHVPAGSIVVSTIDPVYLDAVQDHTAARQVIPLSRDIEYASKLITPKRVENPLPPPASNVDHRCEGLRLQGAYDAVAVVATESVEALRAAIRNGTPVYFLTEDTGAVSPVLPRILRHAFEMEAVDAGLYRLRLKGS